MSGRYIKSQMWPSKKAVISKIVASNVIMCLRSSHLKSSRQDEKLDLKSSHLKPNGLKSIPLSKKERNLE